MSAVVARLDVDLTDIECIVKVTRPLVGVPDSVNWTELPSGVAKISADATLYIFDDDDEGEPERRVIARATAYTVDLDRVGDVVDVFDQVGGEAFEITESILGDENVFEWLDSRDPLVGEQVSQLVIVEGSAAGDRTQHNRGRSRPVAVAASNTRQLPLAPRARLYRIVIFSNKLLSTLPNLPLHCR